jgi:hypothetical protein
VEEMEKREARASLVGVFRRGFRAGPKAGLKIRINLRKQKENGSTRDAPLTSRGLKTGYSQKLRIDRF